MVSCHIKALPRSYLFFLIQYIINIFSPSFQSIGKKSSHKTLYYISRLLIFIVLEYNNSERCDCKDVKSNSNCLYSRFFIDIVHQNSLSKIINSFRKHEERENIIYSPFVDDERYIDGWFALHCCFGGNNYPWRNQFTFTLLFVRWCTQYIYLQSIIYIGVSKDVNWI